MYIYYATPSCPEINRDYTKISPHPLPSRRSFYSTLRKSKRNYTFLHCPFACGWVAKALFFYERIHAHALAHKLAFTVAVLIW